MKADHRILMVCMGNICRSPTAEGVLRHKLRQAGLQRQVLVDSAGTHGWHEGAPPDRRSMAAAARRGYDLSDIRSRPVAAADFERFTLLLAMDAENLSWLHDACPEAHRHKLRRLMELAESAPMANVPDPYSGGAADFERVLDLVELACDSLVRQLQAPSGR
jgi:protein-tyrosine phosphatase